jgi:hypothetical protein
MPPAIAIGNSLANFQAGGSTTATQSYWSALSLFAIFASSYVVNFGSIARMKGMPIAMP